MSNAPLDVEALAMKYGPARSEGGSVTITVTQWRRILHDLATERRRTAALVRVGVHVLEGLSRLMREVNDGEARTLVERITRDLHQAVATIEESRGGDV